MTSRFDIKQIKVSLALLCQWNLLEQNQIKLSHITCHNLYRFNCSCFFQTAADLRLSLITCHLNGFINGYMRACHLNGYINGFMWAWKREPIWSVLLSVIIAVITVMTFKFSKKSPVTNKLPSAQVPKCPNKKKSNYYLYII